MKIVILDTGCANLSSVAYAIRKLGYQPQISQEAATILAADKLLLPGVGTANAAMDQLTQRELIPLIKVLSQPVLGICLGMQLFAAPAKKAIMLQVIISPYSKLLILPSKKWLLMGFHCHTWAGIKFCQKPDTHYSVVLKTMPISILSIATRSR